PRPPPDDPPVLRKVPRVSLERLELDLSGPALPPVFRVFPGASAEGFSLIVIERGQQPVKEEPQEASLSPPVAVPKEEPQPRLPEAPEEAAASQASACGVCGGSGPVVPCSHCQRRFHPQCHLPALPQPPGPEWRCLLCRELPAPTEGTEEEEKEPDAKLSPLDQQVRPGSPGNSAPLGISRDPWIPHSRSQRCEYVLLELLCHEPCRPLQRLSSSADGRDAIDLTLIRAKLQEKLSPPYG
ncbi:TIF1B factor, partial [Centropus bengalensis]|nr:TIF1B factor [Centropus bengalensis]